MITSKEDYQYYLACDKLALRIKKKKCPFLALSEIDLIWKFERLLRKYEYLLNTKKNTISVVIAKIRYTYFGRKLGFHIPENTCGAGLSIAHIGPIIINSNCHIGNNCRIQTGVTVGTTNGNNDAPTIGNNVFLGDGCKVIGGISVADGVQIGANAVVVKDIKDGNTTWGGVPARKISNNSSHYNVVNATELYSIRR